MWKLYLPLFLLCTMIGSTVGLGTFTFFYAEGASYFSQDPKACVNCHVMNQQYASWQGSGHHHVATCAQCHLPQSGIEKYIAKAENGYHHSAAFTLGNFKEPIQIGKKNLAILEKNCRTCHQDLVHDAVIKPGNQFKDKGELSCIQCHRQVGHLPIH